MVLQCRRRGRERKEGRGRHTVHHTVAPNTAGGWGSGGGWVGAAGLTLAPTSVIGGYSTGTCPGTWPPLIWPVNYTESYYYQNIRMQASTIKINIGQLSSNTVMAKTTCLLWHICLFTVWFHNGKASTKSLQTNLLSTIQERRIEYSLQKYVLVKSSQNTPV